MRDCMLLHHLMKIPAGAFIVTCCSTPLDHLWAWTDLNHSLNTQVDMQTGSWSWYKDMFDPWPLSICCRLVTIYLTDPPWLRSTAVCTWWSTPGRQRRPRSSRTRRRWPWRAGCWSSSRPVHPELSRRTSVSESRKSYNLRSHTVTGLPELKECWVMAADTTNHF